jgi:hypothetical protein
VGTFRTPLLQMCLLNFTSNLPSLVPMAFWAKFADLIDCLGIFLLECDVSTISTYKQELRPRNSVLQFSTTHNGTITYLDTLL